MGRDRPIWEILDARSPLYRAEARDYVRHLLAAVDIDPSMRVLDFGCGFGLVAVELSPHVREVGLWDASPHMRAIAARNTAPCANVWMLDEPPGGARGGTPFDLILLNSVLQYVDDEVARQLLSSLAGALSAVGSIVVSDVVTPESSFPREYGELLRYGLERGLLGAVLRESLRVGRRYAAFHRERPPHRRARADLQRLAAVAGLALEFLPANLTCRRERLAAVMRSTHP